MRIEAHMMAITGPVASSSFSSVSKENWSLGWGLGCGLGLRIGVGVEDWG